MDDINDELDLEPPEGNWDSLGGLVFRPARSGAGAR